MKALPAPSSHSVSVPESIPDASSGLHPACLSAVLEGLGSFARLCGAHEAALLDNSGTVLARWDGRERRPDLDAIASLAAASCNATKSMAQRLGDRSFGGVCHQGQEHCLYVAPLIRGYLLLTLHRAGSEIEGIRQSLNRIVPRLNRELVYDPAEDGRKPA